MLSLFAMLLIAVPAIAADIDIDKVYRVGNGVSLPKVLHKVDPSYSKEAEIDRIQGTSLFSLIVDKSGKPRDIELISPIGYGLDEKGLEAVRQWVFKPAEKDSMPVNVKATIYVNFRFPGLAFDSKAEERCTPYNAAIHDLESPAHETTAITTIQKLASRKYPPAMAMNQGEAGSRSPM